MTRIVPTRRHGVAAVEAAVVLPVLFLLIFGLVVGGMGVFHYEQVACLAREGARWASVRGSQYANETNQMSPTQQQIIEQAILPMAVGMDPAAIIVQIVWVDQGTNTAWSWDTASKEFRSITASGEYVSNTVQVTVSYQYTPGLFWGPITVQSVSKMPMSN